MRSRQLPKLTTNQRLAEIAAILASGLRILRERAALLSPSQTTHKDSGTISQNRP